MRKTGGKSELNILAIETTGPVASAAVIDDDDCVLEVVGEGRLTHLEKIIPIIDRALADCDKSLDDIDAIAVSRGPGSFTGIRIGVSTARALAQARNLPVIEVPSLYAAALGVYNFEGLICPVLDARRSQVYAAVYENHWGELTEILPEGAYYPEELAEAAAGRGPAFFLGDGIYIDEIRSVIEEKVGTDAFFSHEDRRVQRAEAVAVIGKEFFEEGRTASYATAQPVYLRKSEAERKREEALKKGL